LTDYYETHRDELIRLYKRYVNSPDEKIRRRATIHIKDLLKPEDITSKESK